jgi:hypothetical protein
MVFINDPVAGANYALNPNDKSATKSEWNPQNRPPRMSRGPDMAGQGGVQGRRQMAPGAQRQNVKTESLGRQTIEGVQADGTRTTMTIPAGQMGNEQPIVIVRESWYSPDLQTVVLSKHTDPRFGETTSRLSNISRGEPARSLFEVPADYKVTTAARPPRQ